MRGDFHWGDAAHQVFAAPELAAPTAFQVHVRGNVRIGTDQGSANTPFTGLVYAPMGNLVVYSRVYWNGCMQARTITLEPDVYQMHLNQTDFLNVFQG